jgi:hypothetical protein
MKLRRRRGGPVTQMRKDKKGEEKKCIPVFGWETLGRPRHIGEDNIKIVQGKSVTIQP